MCRAQTVNECVPSCSAVEYQECQNDFDLCLLALGKEAGSCECLGRFHVCSVDVGCEQLSSGSVGAICDAVGCTREQCQTEYPRATQCDWDIHSECEDKLHTCLALPNSTVRRGYPYTVGNLTRWRGEEYSIEQSRFAQRCRCYLTIIEKVQQRPQATCGEAIEVDYVIPQDHVERTVGNHTYFETVDALYISGDYKSQACMSLCASTSARSHRQELIDFDCAVCGDGEHKSGREECDDGNLQVMDGCDNQCRIEPPHVLTSALIESPPSPTFGKVSLVWNHSAMAKYAAHHNLGHKLMFYVITVDRRPCQDCKSVQTSMWLPYQSCATLEKLTGLSDCAFEVPNLDSGEFVNVTLAAWNLAGMGPSHYHALRWKLLPTGDVNLREMDKEPAGTNKVQLIWNAPSDTGYGDSSSVPILKYYLEISSCINFRRADPVCSYWSADVGPSHDSILQKSTNRDFLYPITFDVKYDLHPGFIYYYRIQPWNDLGAAVQIEEIEAQYGTLPYEVPRVKFPVEFPLAIAVTSTGSQIWQGSALAASVDRIVLQVMGFPLVRTLTEDLVITFTTEGVDVLPSTTIEQTLQVQSSSLGEGTNFLFIPPVLSLSSVSQCGSCIFGVNLRFRRWSSKTITFTMKYFLYQEAALLGVNPYNGPVGGGTTIKLMIQDYEGPRTRAGAGLQSLYGTAFEKQEMTVSFVASQSTRIAEIVEIVGGLLREDMSREYTVTVRLPPSPTQQPAVASLTIAVAGRPMTLITARASLAFEYVGAKILKVNPASGYLNPGSGGASVQIIVANMDQRYLPSVAFAGVSCQVLDTSKPVPNDLGTVMAVSVAVPEIPLENAGMIDVVLLTPGLKEPLKATWEYALPPAPMVDPESIIIAEKTGLWAPASAKGYAGSLVVENLSPAYGIFYDEVQILFGSKYAIVKGFLQLGTSSRIIFTTPNAMAPGMVAVIITVLSQGKELVTVSKFSNTFPFLLEFRDLSEPRILGVAPTEGPTRGGTMVVVSMLSFPKVLVNMSHVNANLKIAVKVGNQSSLDVKPTLLGVVSAKDWIDQGAAYEKLVNLPDVSSYLVGINDGTKAEFDGLVSRTVSAVHQESFDPVIGMRQAAFAVLIMPAVPSSLFGSLLTTELAIAVHEITVKSAYTYTPPPKGAADIRVTTDTGNLLSGLDGDVRLTVILSSFATVYKASDITLRYGDSELEVSRLLYSSQDETKLYIITPPGTPGVINVRLHPTFLSTNFAEFSLEYLDLRVPEVTSFQPSLLYQSGGTDIEAIVSLLPDVPLEDIVVDVLSIGAASTTKLASVLPTKLVREGGVPPEDTAKIYFSVPRGTAGKAQFVINAAKKASTCPEIKPDCQTFMYAAVPTGQPNVLQFSPTIGSSLGGTVMTLKLNNIRRVDDPLTFRVMVQLGDSCSQNTSMPHCLETTIQKSTDSSLQVVSNIRETIVSFTLPGVPDFLGGQGGKILVWDTMNPSFSKEMAVSSRDDSVAEVAYVYPGSIKSTSNQNVDVLVRRLGYISEASKIAIFVAHDSSCETWLESDDKGSACTLSYGSTRSAGGNVEIDNFEGSISNVALGNGGLLVTFSAINKLEKVGRVRITVVNRKLCPTEAQLQAGLCRKKSATFTLEFRAPMATYIEGVSPLSVFQDGRVPVTLTVDNLPDGLGKGDIFAEFADGVLANATRLEIRGPTGYTGLNRASVSVLAPASASATSLVPKLKVPSRGIALNFPRSFSYLRPPDPVFVSCTPSSAPLLTSSPVRIKVQNFPGVSSNTDIAVEFKWPDVAPITALVIDYQQVNSEMFATAVQDYLIDVDTPTGGNVKEGEVVVNIYHLGYRGRQTSLPGFRFIDTTLPQVSGLRTDAGTNGADAVEVRMSASTEIRVTVTNARKAVAAVSVDGTFQALVLSQYDATQRTAKAVFNSGSRITMGTVFAMALFDTSCGAACTTACCRDSSCARSCICRVSCFRLIYFDDLAPKVTFTSGTIGTELGGSVVSLTISNFPVVTASEEESKEVAARFGASIRGRVFVQSSSSLETSLQIETPEIDLAGKFSKTIVLSVNPVSQPDLILNIDYLVGIAVPEISGGILPSKGCSNGGVRTTIRISFFPFPTDVAVAFGDLELPAKSVSIGATSSKQLSTIIFETPKTEPGDFTVRIVPKACPKCGKSVEFTFNQVDSTLPVVLAPVPTGGPWQEVQGATQSMKIAPFPTVYDSFDIACAGDGLIVGKISVASVVTVRGLASIVYGRPSADKIGKVICTLTVVAQGKSKQGTFPYEFYDGTALRLERIDPPQLATRISIYGSTLDLSQTIRLTFANFEQDKTVQEVVVLLGSSTVINVLSVRDTVKCARGSIDCDRTEITIASAPQDVGRNVKFELSAVNGVQGFTFNIPYFAPCDYMEFCTNQGRIADAQMLKQEVPTTEFCDLKFCIDHRSPEFPKAAIQSILPREGPATGGTEVHIYFQNIPAYSPADVTIMIGSGASAIYAKVVSVSNPGGTLLASNGLIQFETPSISNTGALTEVDVEVLVYVGSLRISVKERFLFTPVPTGRAVLASMRPRELFPGSVNSVFVKLTNFPLIKDLSDSGKILAEFDGQTVAASSIVSSTYDATIASFDLLANNAGERQFDVFFLAHGEKRSTLSTITVLPPPKPEVQGVYPAKGIAGRELSLSVTVRYMLPELGQGDFVARLDALGLSIGNVVVMTPRNCQTRYCATVTIRLVVPKEAVESAGGFKTIRVASNKHKEEYVDVNFFFDPSTTPVLESIDPKAVATDLISSTTLTLYISNVKQFFCSDAAKCTVSFVFGQGTQITTRQGTLTGGSFANGLRIVYVKPPFTPNGIEGIASVTVNDNSVMVSEEIKFTSTIHLSPIDSPCNGGVLITVSAMGFGRAITLPSQLSASIGRNTATVTKILSSMVDDDQSLTVFTIMAPVMRETNELVGTVQFSNVKTTFNFECFATPVAVVTPNQAMLSGKTASEDGNSIFISIRNFPALSSAADVDVSFGNVACGSKACSVLSFRNAADTVTLLVTVPPVNRAQQVKLIVDYVGKAQPPAGGDPSKTYIRSRRFVTADFNYYVPAPEAISVLYCDECNAGTMSSVAINVSQTSTSCIVVGSCAGGKVPSANKMAISGAGALTVVVDFVPPIPYSKATGQVDSSALVSIQFGNYPGALKRVLFTDETRSAFEFVLSSLAAPGLVTAKLTIQRDISRPTRSVARFPVKMYDSSIKIQCDASLGCNGQVEGARALVINVSNFVVPGGRISDILSVQFAGIAVTDLQQIGTSKEVGYALFRVIPPAYTCPSCTTANGNAVVSLALLYKTTGEEISETPFTYWSAPKVSELRFDSAGGKLLMTFDQDTNRARMTCENTDCKQLFDSQSLAMLGTSSMCVWQSNRILELFLDSDATVVPGTSLTLVSSGGLKSLNEVSAASAAAARCAIPEVLVPPAVEIKTVETIDPCASLELRATAVSPRPPTYLWSCKNDEYLNEFLSTQSGDTVYLSSGTSVMRIIDKKYHISVSVQDFLGTMSPAVSAYVLKKGTPTPQIRFNPPTETTTRDKEVIIRGEAVFSTCPIPEEDLSFTWRQVSGPALPESLLKTPLPQLQILANTLKEGSVYLFALRLRMSTDSSKNSESIFVLNTEYQGLQAVLAGGASTTISSSASISLSAAESRDLDLHATENQNLSFSWTCKFRVNGFDNDCRNGTEAFRLPARAEVFIPPGMLPAAEFPYVFTVTVAKAGRSPVKASKGVYIRAGSVPTIQISGGGGATKSGSLYVSSNGRLVFTGLTNKPQCRAPSTTYETVVVWSNSSNSTNATNKNNTKSYTMIPIHDPGIVKDCMESIQWSFEPPIKYFYSDVPFGFRQSQFVLNSNPKILRTGNSYTLKFSGAIVGGGQGEASIQLLVNTPPLSGIFSTCLAKPGEKGCIKSGVPITDEFRLSCSGWVDVDLPLKYEFGYKSVSGPYNNITETVWYGAVADNSRDMGFPVGSVTVMAYVSDAYGAKTDLLSERITISDAVPGGRRLLSSDSFLEKAKAKLQGALQTFRADKINQMAGSMSLSSGGMSADGRAGVNEFVLSTMASSVDRSTPTTGGQCESFSAAKAVAKDADSLSGAAVGGMAAMMKNMLKNKLAGAMDLGCASNAAGSLGGSLKAQALYKKANPGKSLVSPGGAAEFMQSLEGGMKQVMRQAGYDAVMNEGPRMVSLDTAEHNVNRLQASSLRAGATYEMWSHPIPAMFPTNVPGAAAAIRLPDTFNTDIFGTSNPIIDVHTQAHGYAPEVAGFTTRSPLVGLTVSREKSSEEIAVKNLSKPIYITIPVDTSKLTDTARMLFSQQARCVFWNNHTYSMEGCNVSEASINSVTCKCNHLTLFAIHHDQNAPACGDGVLQAGEGCDDGNLRIRDGCDAQCKPEPYCECSGEPSVCKCLRPITNNMPEDYGVKGTLTLGGFTSKQDFITGQAAFQMAVAEALAIEGLGGADVVVLTVCYGSDCTENWIISRRRFLDVPQAANHTDSPPELRAQKIVVDFFINRGNRTTSEIFKQLSRASFSSTFVATLKALTGREITAVINNIVVVEEGSLFSRPGFGSNGDAAGSEGAASLFKLADEAAQGLSLTAIVLIAVAGVLIAVALFIKRVFIPIIKRMKEGHEYRERMKDAIGGKKSLHPEVAKSMKEMNALNDPKMKSKYSTQYGNGNVDAVEEIPGVFDSPADLPIADIQTAESLERELVDPSADPVTQTAYLATQANQPTRFASSFTGAEATQAPATKVGGKWNHARSRLANLEAQLDALLDDLPVQYLPTPPDSAAEGREKSVDSVVPFYQDDAGENHSAPRDGESGGALDEVSSVANSRTGRSSGVLKIKVPRTEKSKYKRPSIPDPLTGMDQFSRSSRKPITPDGESTRPSAAGIRRAPDLIFIFDENYSPAAVAASARTQEPSTPKLSSDAAAPDDLTTIDLANKTIEVEGIVASVKPSPKRVRDAWKVKP
jgi:cysteine-rich repeat protein